MRVFSNSFPSPWRLSLCYVRESTTPAHAHARVGRAETGDRQSAAKAVFRLLLSTHVLDPATAPTRQFEFLSSARSLTTEQIAPPFVSVATGSAISPTTCCAAPTSTRVETVTDHCCRPPGIDAAPRAGGYIPSAFGTNGERQSWQRHDSPC